MSFVQSKSAEFAPNVARNLAFTNPVKVGNWVWVWYTRWARTGPAADIQVTDNLGNTYAYYGQALQLGGGDNIEAYLFGGRISFGGACTITAPTQATEQLHMVIHEASGELDAVIAPVAGQDTTGAVDNVNPGFAVATYVDGYALGFVTFTDFNGTPTPPGTGFTVREVLSTAAGTLIESEDMTLGQPGPTTAPWTSASHTGFQGDYIAAAVFMSPVGLSKRSGLQQHSVASQLLG